jgi:hypothetical protein
MIEIAVHPNVYSTGKNSGLIQLLEQSWVRECSPGDGTIYIFSGFGNFNGGVRFYEVFKNHVAMGGQVQAFFAGSSSARLTSKQVVRELIEVGAEVRLTNRKRLVHMKSYGVSDSRGDQLVVTSGNFTGPGMSQNVEMSVYLDRVHTKQAGFNWENLVKGFLDQKWDHYLVKSDEEDPSWRLLYDEQSREVKIEDTQEITMLLTLSHADTARINADSGTDAGKGTQYFWLSKDCFDFFPPLTIKNERGSKPTFSCIISINYVDIGVVDSECRVTFEAGNNLDFRLGTSALRYQKVCEEGDLAAITRRKETEYEIRLFRQGSPSFSKLEPYATNFIGHKGKRYGYLTNRQLDDLVVSP